MATLFSVRLSKEDLVFSAAHFITFGDNICERIHGHNYRVTVEVAGPLGVHGYVVDFIALHKAIREMLSELDHRVLLPTQHPSIHVSATGAEVEARFETRRWLFPHEDCALLPISNTTAELLAEYLCDQLISRRSTFLGENLHRMRIQVDENHGQWGGCERALI